MPPAPRKRARRARRTGPDTERVREDFVELWGRMASFWGVTPGAARVYAGLLAREAGADTDALMEQLAMSRGAVSMATRELLEWGLAVPRREAGSRRVTYLPETDLEKAVRSIVQVRKRREWDPILERLREWIPELEGARDADARVFRERLQAIEATVAMADSMAERFLEGGVVQRLGLKALVSAARASGRRRSARARRTS